MFLILLSLTLQSLAPQSLKFYLGIPVLETKNNQNLYKELKKIDIEIKRRSHLLSFLPPSTVPNLELKQVLTLLKGLLLLKERNSFQEINLLSHFESVPPSISELFFFSIFQEEAPYFTFLKHLDKIHSEVNKSHTTINPHEVTVKSLIPKIEAPYQSLTIQQLIEQTDQVSDQIVEQFDKRMSHCTIDPNEIENVIDQAIYRIFVFIDFIQAQHIYEKLSDNQKTVLMKIKNDFLEKHRNNQLESDNNIPFKKIFKLIFPNIPKNHKVPDKKTKERFKYLLIAFHLKLFEVNHQTTYMKNDKHECYPHVVRKEKSNKYILKNEPEIEVSINHQTNLYQAISDINLELLKEYQKFLPTGFFTQLFALLFSEGENYLFFMYTNPFNSFLVDEHKSPEYFLSSNPLQHYLEKFPQLEHTLKNAKTYMDLGTGFGVTLMQASLLFPQLKRLIGCSMELSDEYCQMISRYFPKIQLINQPFEEIKLYQLLQATQGKVDVLTDVFGIIPYQRPLVQLNKILSLMKPKSFLFVQKWTTCLDAPYTLNTLMQNFPPELIGHFFYNEQEYPINQYLNFPHQGEISGFKIQIKNRAQNLANIYVPHHTQTEKKAQFIYHFA